MMPSAACSRRRVDRSRHGPDGLARRAAPLPARCDLVDNQISAREDIDDVASSHSVDEAFRASDCLTDAATNLSPFVEEDWSRRHRDYSTRFS